MAETSLAHPGHETTARVARAAKLFDEHFDRFSYAGRGVYVVPSGSDLAPAYEVTLRGDAERCECADHRARGARCKHVIGARIYKAKTGTCAGCGERHRRRDMLEVPEGHEMFYEGDRVCGGCARRHGVL